MLLKLILPLELVAEVSGVFEIDCAICFLLGRTVDNK